jgi:hypothetical protein
MPAFYERRDEWQLYAFDPTERQKVGRRSREWTAVAPTQERVVRAMARVLLEIGEGQVCWIDCIRRRSSCTRA